MSCQWCDELGCSECLPTITDPRYLAFDRALREAMAERGRIVLNVFCAQCKDGPTLARVHHHPRWGRFYESKLVSSVSRSKADQVREAKMRQRHGRRIPPTLGVCAVLLDHPAEVPGPFGPPHRQDHPVAECQKHGRDELDRAVLIELIQANRRSSPAVATIHRRAAFAT